MRWLPVLLLLLPGLAHAQSSATLVEPTVPVGDLASCEMTVTVGAQPAHVEVFPASAPTGGGSHVLDLATTGLVLEGPASASGTCIDTSGNVSAPGGAAATFPDQPPPAPSLSLSP